MRGLKCLTGHTVVCFNYVASLRDVWIKISIRWRIKLLVQSHPSWVRGLKQRKNICYLNYFSVAPFMDAWIKMQGYPPAQRSLSVVSLADTWITEGQNTRTHQEWVD